jgi:hypothetical protein
MQYNRIIFYYSGVAKGGEGGGEGRKNHSLKKAKSVEKWGGGGTRYMFEAETD